MTRKAARKKFERPEVRSRARATSWVAMGALVASTALGARDAQARELAAVLRASDELRPQLAAVLPLGYSRDAVKAAAHDQPVRRFDIPGGTLDSVIAAFTKATAVAVHLPNVTGVPSIYSPGVSGTFTIEQALQQILSGTSLGYRLIAPDTAVLEFRTQAESVDVTAAAPVSVSPKYATPLVDTPQSIDVIPAGVMAAQGVTTLRDAVRNVAGISLAAGEGGSQGDNLTIRGFTARNDIFMDGMRDFGSYYRDPFNQEAVQRAGAYALDTASIGSKLDLIGGARWDRFDASYAQSVAPAASFTRVDTVPSWRGAIVYKPTPVGSLYFDYGTSRTLLFDLDAAIQQINRDAPDRAAAVQLTGVYHNLVRRWAEL